jgi:hypothetical protein
MTGHTSAAQAWCVRGRSSGMVVAAASVAVAVAPPAAGVAEAWSNTSSKLTTCTRQVGLRGVCAPLQAHGMHTDRQAQCLTFLMELLAYGRSDGHSCCTIQTGWHARTSRAICVAFKGN